MLGSGLGGRGCVITSVTVEVDGRLKSTTVSVSYLCSDLTGTEGVSA